MCLAIGDDVDDLTPGPPAPVFDDNDAADNGAVLRREQILRLFNWINFLPTVVNY